jgi:predicted DNA-binding protein (UPF0251 family)
MLTRHRKKLVAGLAALAVVVGGGAAIAATGSNSPKQESQAVVNDAAKQLGVQPSELTAALKQALKNRVDAAVAAGRLTKAQGQAMKERIDAGEVPLFGFGPGPGGPRGLHHVHVGLDAAASYLGMSQAALQSALENGKTLAQVTQDKGKSVDGLVAAMVSEEKAELAAAVKAGRLTQAQSDAIQADLKARVTDLVNGKLPAPPDRGGPGFGFGPPPAVAPSSSSSSTATA